MQKLFLPCIIQSFSDHPVKNNWSVFHETNISVLLSTIQQKSEGQARVEFKSDVAQREGHQPPTVKRTDDGGEPKHEGTRAGIPKRFSFAASGKNHEGRYTRPQIFSERRISKGNGARISRFPFSRARARARGDPATP